MLGACEKVIVSKDSTIIMDGKTSKEVISHRIAQIKEQLSKSESEPIIRATLGLAISIKPFSILY